MRAKLAFRQVANRETIPSGVGETITKTRRGSLPVVTAPINTQGVSAQVATTVTGNPLLHTAAKLDDGLIPITNTFEQYTITMEPYGSTIDFNTITSQVAIAKQFALNAQELGDQAARSLDGLARTALYGVYLGGNTYVRVAPAAGATAVAVDDLRGFLNAPRNGSMQPVTPQNPLAVQIGDGLYSVTSVAVDATNVSVAAGGFSGTLTLAGAVNAAHAAVGSPVVATVAPRVVRPNDRRTDAALTAGDRLTMAAIMDAVAELRSNAIPTVDGLYNVYMNAVSQRQLFADPDFKQLFQGAAAEAAAMRSGTIEDAFLGARFIVTTQTPVQNHPTVAGLRVHAPIVVGQGALIETQFAGTYNKDDGGIQGPGGEEVVVDGVRMVTRPPLDRLGQVISQSWQWIGGYAAPTDLTSTPAVITSATNAAHKRAVVLRHSG